MQRSMSPYESIRLPQSSSPYKIKDDGNRNTSDQDKYNQMTLYKLQNQQQTRAQSASITQRNAQVRQRAKEALEQERAERFHMLNERRENYLSRWKDKTKHSPFLTDQVAESDRIAEETQVRIKEEEERRKGLLIRREKAKNDIILTALSEYSDLEALRQEKRAILEEEQRILALLALEKTSHQHKSDRIVAERALKQRQTAKTSYRRQHYKEELEKVYSEEYMALRVKHGLLPLDYLGTSDMSRASSFDGIKLSSSRLGLKS